MPIRVRRTLLGAGCLLAVLVLWTLLALLSARSHLDRARSAIEEARSTGLGAGAGPALDRAEQELRTAAGRARQPGPRLLSQLPVLGRSPRAVAVAAEESARVVRSGRAVLDALPDQLLVDGRVDLDAVRALGPVSERTSADIRRSATRVSALRTAWTPGPVGAGIAELRGELEQLQEASDRATAALDVVLDVLGGDRERRLLLALQNNAELRATGGVVTVFGEARATDGRLVLSAFRDVEDVADQADEVRPVPAPEDFRRLYGDFLAATTLWKNVNMSPDVPTSSVVMAEVAAATLGRPTDVVVWFDVPLIAALLRAVGPVELPDGRRLDGDNAVKVLLSDAYREAPNTPAGQRQRREALRGAADAVLDRLLEGSSPEGSSEVLARELSLAAAGRHLALWSSDPKEQEQVVRSGLAGEVRAGDGDLSVLTVHNLGGGDRDGNKLDYYGRRQSTISVLLGSDEAVVEQELEVRNTAPDSGLPVYVAGRVTPSVVNAFVTLSVPNGATDLRVERGGRPLGVTGAPEGDHQVVTDVVSIAPGSTTTWVLRYRVPVTDGAYALRLVPQPLAVPGGVSVTVRADDATLSVPAGTDLDDDGALRVSGPFAEVVEVRATYDRGSLLDRTRRAVSRFWREPVTLG